MLPRLIIGLLLIIGVVVLLRGLRAGARGEHRAIERGTLRCARCAVYFPREEAVVVDGRAYCSREHAEQGGA